MSINVPEGVQFDASGLVPVVVQDRASGDVLMVAWANAEALDLTARTGLAHFWSRKRGALWKKGETSGHVLHAREMRRDCDGDTLLLVADRAKAAPADSYTAGLLAKGQDQVLKKIGEEATEVVLAAKGESDERLAEECADLLYHVLVVLEQRRVRPTAVLDVLRGRRESRK